MKTTNQLQKSGMKFLTGNKKIFFSIILIILGNTMVFAQEQQIISNSGFSTESLFRGLLGMVFLIFISFLFSSNRKAIKWKNACAGLGFQLILAICILKLAWVQNIFEFAGRIFIKILDFTMEGTSFLFAPLGSNQIGDQLLTFIVTILPTVIFFSAITSVLFYFGIIQKVVKVMAIVLSKVLGISGPESLSVAGNVFLGQTESPLLIKAYLEKMSKSEILLVMIGGMATVAGGVLAIYIKFLGGGDEYLELFYAKHLLTASVIAAPGAIVISKILYPETENINSKIDISNKKFGVNFLDAISNGTVEGLKLAANIAAMLLVFIAFVAMINYTFGLFGDITGLNVIIAENTKYYESLDLEFILGYLFAPLMWIIGVSAEDSTLMGQLLGIKVSINEFIAYENFKEIREMLDPKSIIIATYMICGFANFSSIGIQIGGIGSLAPGQRKNLSKFGFKALIGGTIASLLSATLVGMIMG